VFYAGGAFEVFYRCTATFMMTWTVHRRRLTVLRETMIPWSALWNEPHLRAQVAAACPIPGRQLIRQITDQNLLCAAVSFKKPEDIRPIKERQDSRSTEQNTEVLIVFRETEMVRKRFPISNFHTIQAGLPEQSP